MGVGYLQEVVVAFLMEVEDYQDGEVDLREEKMDNQVVEDP
jgi:hypothetical protein